MTSEAKWECPRCGERRFSEEEAVRHLRIVHDDRTTAPTLEEEQEGETNRAYVTRRGAEAAQFAYERERAAGFTEEQARALAADAELQARHLARRELGLPTSPLPKPTTT